MTDPRFRHRDSALTSLLTSPRRASLIAAALRRSSRSSLAPNVNDSHGSNENLQKFKNPLDPLERSPSRTRPTSALLNHVALHIPAHLSRMASVKSVNSVRYFVQCSCEQF